LSINILIVDNDELQLILLNDLLKKENKLFFAKSAEEAIEIMQRYNNIDIAMIDYRLPRMNGIELCSYMDNYYPNITKILMTA